MQHNRNSSHQTVARVTLGWLMMIWLVTVAFAGPFSYGPKQFTQPNGAKFEGIYAGDEFETWLTTTDDYRFVGTKPDGSTGPYEYATLNANGDFTGSGLFVGIDPPPAEAYMLDRSGAAKAAIIAARDEFASHLDDLPRWRDSTLAACARNEVLTIDVGILLVDFPDRPHVAGAIDPVTRVYYAGQRPRAVNNMMNSLGTYHGDQPGHALNDPELHNWEHHPTVGHWVFGSFREYWREASYGQWDTPCTIINPNDGDTTAEWLTMPRGQWEYPHYSWWPYREADSLATDALLHARARGWNVDDYDQIIILYPGEIRNTLYPSPPWPADSSDRYFYWLTLDSNPQCTIWPLWEHGDLDWRFTHIGTLVHEWGHTIGWRDFTGGAWASLMAQGNGCGPAVSGASRPSRLGALQENQIGWLECMAQHGTGGIIDLTAEQPVTLHVPSQNGHYVYRFGNYYLEARHIRWNLLYQEGIRGNGWQGMDDFMFQGRNTQVPPGANLTQMVIWDASAAGDPYGNHVVRNNASMTYRFPCASDGGVEAWFAWPGTFAQSPDSMDWTPFTFPNTGITHSALLNILPNDVDSTIGFDFRLNYPQPGPVHISNDVFVLARYDFTDDLIIESGGALWTGYPFRGRVSQPRFGPGAGMVVQSGGGLQVPTQAVVFQAIAGGQNPAWRGISVHSQSSSNLFSGVVADAEVGILVNGGYLNLDSARINSCGLGVAWVRASGEMHDCIIQNNSRYGAYVIDSEIALLNNTIRWNLAGGLRLWRADQIQVIGNTITYNGTGHLSTSPYWAGMEIIEGSVVLACNNVSNNEGAGLMLFGQSYADM